MSVSKGPDRVLVTGGAGFIGSAVCRALVRQGQHVFNIDALTYASNLASLSETEGRDNYRFMHGDIRDPALLEAAFAHFAPNRVVHLAAETHVDRSIASATEFVQTNVVGTQVLLDAALRYWEALKGEVRHSFRFLHVSTDEVFGSLGEDGAFDESSPYDPRSPYAASKAASDHLVNAWGHTYGLPVLRSNASNNYGPFQFPEKFIPLMIVNALVGKPLPLYGDGANVRDWLYVDDHVEGLLRILRDGRVGESYVLGGSAQMRNVDVAHRILDLVAQIAPGSTMPEIQFVADRAGHDRRYAVDCQKIGAELNWRPKQSFETGLERTVGWFFKRQDWWRPILDGRYGGERLGLRDAL